MTHGVYVNTWRGAPKIVFWGSKPEAEAESERLRQTAGPATTSIFVVTREFVQKSLHLPVPPG